MSSVGPDEDGSEVNSGEEAASGFVMAGGDSPVLLEFSEKVLDRTSGFIKFPAIRARRPTAKTEVVSVCMPVYDGRLAVELLQIDKIVF